MVIIGLERGRKGGQEEDEKNEKGRYKIFTFH